MGLALLVTLLVAQSSTRLPQPIPFYVMVLPGCEEPPPASSSPDVQQRVREFLQRCAAFTPRVRSLPGLTDGEREMIDSARQGYERLLWTMARDSSARTAALAAAYVEALRPCYEWEGYHDCPEHEAMFADEYMKNHPKSPFAEFLPLLAAHRWQCAADAYEYEARARVPDVRGSVGVSDARRRGAADLAKALRSADPLVRLAAETLNRTRSCF